jgi:hypothetical protein
MIAILFCLFGMKRIVAFGESSALKNIIQQHALRTSILNEVVSDLLDKPFITHIIEAPNHYFDYSYIAFSAISISYIQYYSFSNSKIKKLPYYQETYKKYKLWLFILLFVFTKNIENAI